MKISLGQFIPGTSFIHKLDPRTKFISMIAYMVAIMLIDNFIGYAFAGVFVIMVYLVSRLPIRYVLRSIRPVLFIVLFTVLLNLFIYDGETVVFKWKFIIIYKEAIIYCVKIILRILLLVTGAALLTYTTESSVLTNGLESLFSPLKIVRFPAHEIAMMMNIALRFIPIFAEELDRIVKAQKARGVDFDTRNPIKKIRNYMPILIPLFVGAWKRAADLATAMNARGYRGGTGRTKYRILRFTFKDLIGAIIIVFFVSSIVIMRILL